MKKSLKLNKKWSVFYLLLLLGQVLLLSCNKNQEVLPQNTISLKYNGETITFDEIKVREDYLDLDAGKGIRAICSQNVLDKNNFTYYVILDFQKISESEYRFHKIHFGTQKQLAKDFIQLELYFAELTDGFNKTNFQTSMSKDASEVKGTFSGKLISLTAPEVSVNEGKYSFFLRTVKK